MDETRDRLARDFVAKVYSMVAQAHPSIHPVVLQARTKLFTKFELGLKIALSKHQVVDTPRHERKPPPQKTRKCKHPFSSSQSSC